MYQRSKIYKLLCNNGKYYIGGTIEELNVRLNKHKSLCKQSNVNKIYSHCNEIGWDNITIELIENYPCNSIKELNTRIDYHLTQNENKDLCLNYLESTRDYQEGKIYKLQCKDGHYYIGSTIQTLANRFSSHKSASKTQTSHAYQYINTIGWENVTIELVEYYPCDTKDHLDKKEDDYLKQHIEDPMCLNRHRSYVSEEEDKQKKKQYYEEHKEDLLEYQRKYKEENRDYILHRSAHYRLTHADELVEKQKEYVTKNKEKVQEARRKRYEQNKEKEQEYHKQYVQTHQEEMKQYKKAWAERYKETHVEEIAEERAQKRVTREEKKQARITYDQTIVSCECGGSYQHYRKKRHIESKKHQHFMENSTSNNLKLQKEN